MNRYLLAFLLFFLAFLIFPFGVSPFESGKIIIADAGLLFFCLTTINFSFLKNLWHSQRSLCLFYGIIFIISVFDLLFLRLPDTFLGSIYRGQGILLLWLLLLFSLLSSLVKVKMSPFILKILLVLECAISLFISPSIDGRFIGTLGEPNSLAGFLLFLWPFALLAKQKHNKLIVRFLLLFTVVILIGTGSRSGLIGFGLQILFLIFYRFFHVSFGKSSIIVLILLIVSLILPFFDNTSLYENRALIWQTAFITGLKSPIIGQGFGNIQPVLHETSQQLHNALRKENIDSSHNLFLDWFVQAGMVGILFILAIIGISFKQIVKSEDNKLFLSCLGILSIMLFNPVSIVLLIAFWWIIGQTIVAKNSKS